MSRESSVPVDGGSRTMTQTGSATPDTRTPENQAGPSDPIVGVLKLRGDRSARRQKVVFSEGTVDNEGMGKKKSKICCIYHKPRAYDESSDESSSEESDCGHDHHKSNVTRHATARKTEGSSEAHEQAESSESEGGGGDGRAKPPKKAPKGEKTRQPPEGTANGRNKGKTNKYDHPPASSGSTK